MSNKILKNIKNENGQAALLLVLIVMMMLLFVGLFLTNTVTKQIRATKNVEKFTQAYFLADSGTERILYEIKKGNIDPIVDGPDLLNETIAGLGSYIVEVESTSPSLKIKATGFYGNTARAIEISW
ncbi:hypothetical protein KAI56_03660 [Candidatus Parcubacteria bacterium]|nr:hypothetical protein [Candidatus Parcubacteria bacterium]